MAVNPSATVNTGSRRVLVGLNVLVGSMLACVAFGLAIWAAGRFGGRIDVSSNQVNSLSDGTVKLLRKLDGDVKLTAAYTTANKEAFKYREKHKKFVSDLLDLYESSGRGKVSTAVVDPQQSPGAMEQLLKRLREKPAYTDESKPHKEALEQYPALVQVLGAFGQAESAELERLMKSDDKLKKAPEPTIISRTAASLEQQSKRALADVDEILKSEVPRYGQAITAIRDGISTTREQLQKWQDWLSGSGAGLSGISEETRAFFSTASQRYQPVIAKLDEFLKKSEKLQPVKIETLLDGLKGGQCVIVETANEAQVLPESEVWAYRNNRDGPPPADGDPQEFAGEEAISSALLHLTQKEKTAVILTRFGGTSLLMPDFSRITNPAQLQNMPPAPYEALNERLTKDNFQAVEWDVKTEAKPPATPDAKRLVYVVFPPEPPPQANPMQPSRQPGISPEQKQLVLNAVAESGMAMFLASWTPSQMPMMVTPYDYNDYLMKEWGVEVRNSFVTVEFTINPQRQGVFVPASRTNPFVLDSETGFKFTKHPIAAPIAALPGGLAEVAPLVVAKGSDLPAGVTIESIAEVPKTENVWAFDNIMRVQQDMQKKQGTTRAETDMAGPFPIALSGEKKVGDGKTSRVVVISSERFAANQIADAAAPVMVGNQIVMAQLYPANLNLFVNSLHWLTGNADRIAVAPTRGDVARLKMSDGQAVFVKAFVVIIWPVLALMCGVAVWMWRR